MVSADRSLAVPDPSLVVLVGIAGCGKSTFARDHFRPTEVVSSDGCRALVADDPDDQSATADAFSVLTFIIDKRLRRGRLAVADATSLRRPDRRRLLGLARAHDVPAVGVVLALPLELCRQRDAQRRDRTVGAEVLANQRAQLERALTRLDEEEFTTVHLLSTPDDVAGARVVRVASAGPAENR